MPGRIGGLVPYCPPSSSAPRRRRYRGRLHAHGLEDRVAGRLVDDRDVGVDLVALRRGRHPHLEVGGGDVLRGELLRHPVDLGHPPGREGVGLGRADQAASEPESAEVATDSNHWGLFFGTSRAGAIRNPAVALHAAIDF